MRCKPSKFTSSMRHPEYVQVGINDRFCNTLAKSSKFGPAYLGMWVLLKGELSKSPTLSLSITNELDHEFLKTQIGASDQEMRSLIEYACACGQLDIELYREGILWSQNLSDELATFFNRNKVKDIPKRPVRSAKFPNMVGQLGIFPNHGGVFGNFSGDDGTNWNYSQDFEKNSESPPRDCENSHIDRIDRIDRERDMCAPVHVHVPADARDESKPLDEFKENRLKNFQAPSGGGNGEDVEQYLIEEKELQAFALEFITAYGKNGTVDKVVQGIRDAAKEALARKPNQDMGKFRKALLRKARESREKDQLDDISDRYRLKPEKWLEGRNYLLDYKPKTSTGNTGTGTENGTPQWNITRD